MLSYFRGLLSFCLIALSWQAQADEKVVTWIQTDFPPGIIQNGPLKGTGYFQTTVNALKKDMAAYRHVGASIPLSDVVGTLLGKKEMCAFGLVKTEERERFIVFSKPILEALPTGALMSKETFEKVSPYINAKGEMDLEKVILDTDLRFGFQKGRRYGGVIDKTLQKFRDYNPGRFWERDIGEGAFSVIDLLLRGRIDILFGYSVEIQYAIRSRDMKASPIFVPLKGSALNQLAYVGCPKTPWGKSVIADIDKSLHNINGLQIGNTAYADWLTDNARDRYWKLVR